MVISLSPKYPMDILCINARILQRMQKKNELQMRNNQRYGLLQLTFQGKRKRVGRQRIIIIIISWLKNLCEWFNN